MPKGNIEPTDGMDAMFTQGYLHPLNKTNRKRDKVYLADRQTDGKTEYRLTTN